MKRFNGSDGGYEKHKFTYEEVMKLLIKFLNTFDKLHVYKIEQEEDSNTARIYLHYGDGSISYSSWESYVALMIFVKRLADAISIVLEEAGGYKSPLFYLTMCVMWQDEKEYPIFYMDVPVDSLAELANLFYKVRKEFAHSIKGKKDINFSELIA